MGDYVSNIVEQILEKDPFGSQIVASPYSVINYKPTWGVSALRYSTTTTGTGAAVTETGGEFKLSSGTTTTNVAQIETLLRGQYQAGTEASFGIGVRLPTAPASTAEVMWGYFDDNNGFCFGQDATGIFVCRRSGGSDNKVYQTDWNRDKLNGAGGSANPSGLTLSLANGVISQCKFTWYGYGVIKFGFVMYNSTTYEFETVICHIIKVDAAVSVVDPNQPLRFRTANGASSTTNLDLYIGGHQFEYYTGNSQPQVRIVSELLTNYTTATNTNWQPLLAVRKKATHGTSSRTNSVRVRVKGYEVSGDGEMETRLTFGGATSNLSWATPTGWTAAEAAVETKITTSGTALTTSSDGFPFAYDFVNASKTSIQNVRDESVQPIGATGEIILWVRRISAVGAIVVKHASLLIEEEW